MKWNNFSQIPIVSLNFTATSYTGTITWDNIDKSGSKLSDISDVPEYTGNANKVLTVKSDESGVEWSNITISNNIDKFIDLNDTPTSYIGQAGKFVRVKLDEKGLEFSDIEDIVTISYKQLYVENISNGDVVTINLQNYNSLNNRHVFILQKIELSVMDISPFTFQSSEDIWNYDSENVVIDGTISLKLFEFLDTKINNTMFIGEIDTSKYKEIVFINVKLR